MKRDPAEREEEGQIHVLESSDLFIRTRLEGCFGAPLVERFVTVMDAWRGSRTHLFAFHDGESVDDYDVSAREGLTSWSRRHIWQFSEVHILVRQRSVAWAVRIMQMAIGGPLFAHHGREGYDAAFARARGHDEVASARLAARGR